MKPYVHIRLEPGGEYLMSPNPDSFAIELRNLDPTRVIVGVRVQLGTRCVFPTLQHFANILTFVPLTLIVILGPTTIKEGFP